MTSELTVASSSGEYTVRVARGSLADALHLVDAIVVDQALVHHIRQVQVPVIAVNADERLKTLGGVEQLAGRLRAAGLVRNSVLGAVGGGTVQDVSTLTSSLYMRGISWVYVPTTLLGMVDSCIGGKSAINAAGYKNLLGNFHPPSRIFVDPFLARSLSASDVVGGIAEAVKICYASSHVEFNDFVDSIPVQGDLSADLLERACWLSLSAKKRIIEVDEFDTGERQLLNFGHTFGHALESATAMALPHGLGVALGMRAAIRYTDSPLHPDTARLDAYAQAILTTALRSGWTLPPVDWNQFIVAFESDKKHTADHYRLVLPMNNGRLEVIAHPRDERTLRNVRLAAEYAWETA